MKKQFFSLLALGLASTAFAQSSVTVFGSIDLNVTRSKAGSNSVTGMDQGGYLLPSRIGFRGTEDLGGGLSAGFWLETAVLPDTGASQGALFGRRSTVSLASKQYGELRMGRDYTPIFWNVSHFTPFGTVGVGGSSNIIEGWPLGLGSARTQSRASNSVGYFLPRTLGGVYGQLMFAFDEDVDGAKHQGGRIGYEAGPLNIAAAYGTTPAGGSDFKTATVGGTYDFGALKAYVNYLQYKLASDKQTNVLVGAAIPFGGGTIKASIARSDRSGPGLDADDARQVAIGYVYPLSKRTTLYTAYSHITNDGNAAYVTADSSPAGVPGEKSSGFQFGINHAF
ncbi:porin [Noviherbaspirillum saxi]|uniref:Porin n=1 Tax=Noviherbaspirillum saxi TaxID=2320863 RepID=A0A3A3G059_9BURK|nr:porin [Noviherbaspirillum saxi]RJF92709.1 porin [Noviherbaspirillum saxi]